MFSGIDCSRRLTEADVQVLRRNKYSFVGRYLVPLRYSKALTPGEAKLIMDGGLGLLLCWELTADRARGGVLTGMDDGEAAAALARTIGAPAGTAIYFAVDFDAQEKDMDAVEGYLRGAVEAIGEYRLGVYGGERTIEAMRRRKAAEVFWQCVAWSRQKSEACTVYQSEWQCGPEALRMGSLLGFWVDIDETEDLRKAGIWKKEEHEMTGEEIYNALMEYEKKQLMPAWAEKELREAEAMGITDGSRPCALIPRYQAAIMAKRAVEAALKKVIG